MVFVYYNNFESDEKCSVKIKVGPYGSELIWHLSQGGRVPLTTKNEAPAPKFYKIEAPKWQF